MAGSRATHSLKAQSRTAISAVLLAVALSIGAWYIVAHRARFAVLLTVPLPGIAALATLTVAFRAGEAIVLRLAVRHLGVSLGIGESNLLAWATGYWNLLPAKPGTGALALYLKHRHNVHYSGFAAYVIAVNLLRVAAGALVGAVASFVFWTRGQLPPILPVVFGSMLACCALVMVAPSRWHYEGRSRILRALSNTGHAWHVMRARRGLLLRISWLRAVECGLGASGTWLCFRLTGTPLSAGQALVLMPVSMLVHIVTLVPGQLGVREALAGAVAAAFGYTFADGTVASTLGRATGLPLVLLGGTLSSWWLHKRWTGSAQPQRGLPRQAPEAAPHGPGEGAEEGVET
jgi:uncharacterized membrane protein YbhN (UPF0104 family)